MPCYFTFYSSYLPVAKTANTPAIPLIVPFSQPQHKSAFPSFCNLPSGSEWRNLTIMRSWIRSIPSLVPRLLAGREKRAWYLLFAHARNYPLLNTCLGQSGRGTYSSPNMKCVSETRVGYRVGQGFHFRLFQKQCREGL